VNTGVMDGPAVAGDLSEPADGLSLRPQKDSAGAPGRIRTCDPRIRSPTLYPAELRARAWRRNEEKEVERETGLEPATFSLEG
jgi:hypothetical protein